ncbi:MAG: hypothetical protein ACLQFR_05075 [Streptosporangiaceae bacterium]
MTETPRPRADLAGRYASLSPVERELDDALYYLRHDCVPCAERHFELARQHGASDADVEAIRAQASELL